MRDPPQDSCQRAFLVVSHDERFLTEIGVNRWLRLGDGTLKETAAPRCEPPMCEPARARGSVPSAGPPPLISEGSPHLG
ncbi:hypothetical protein CP971_33260 [Streptomyces viridifaciens]|nr:hypothetical protein CP971_33260 [Streptomyces viridifaciens]